MYGSESDTAVLIDRDAYLYGSFRAVCAENIDILGYGVIDGSREVRTDESRLLLNDYTAPLPADRENILRRLKQRHVLDGILRFTVAATSGWRVPPCATPLPLRSSRQDARTSRWKTSRQSECGATMRTALTCSTAAMYASGTASCATSTIAW